MSNAMSSSKSRWKGALLAAVATTAVLPLAAMAQSMQLSVVANPLGGGTTSPNKYKGFNTVFIDPYDKDTLYVYATVTGTSAPSPTYVDGLEYAYFNVNATAKGATGLGLITAATPSANFGGGAFNQTTTAPGAGAQGGAISTTAYTSTSSIAVGDPANLGSVAKPRSPGDFYWSSPTGSGSNVVVSGNSVSFLIETLTYTPTSAQVVAHPSTVAVPNSVTFNVSSPSALLSPNTVYTGSNYFVGLPTTPALGVSPGASNTSSTYTTSTSNVTLYDALPGDVNLDGSVNIADFNILGGNFGKSVTGGYTVGDLNNDGTVNIADFNILGGNFGKSFGFGPSLAGPTALLASSGTSAVPEPVSATGLLVGGVAAAMLRRRRI